MTDPLIHITHDVPSGGWRCSLCNVLVGSLDLRFRCDGADPRPAPEDDATGELFG